MNGIAVAYNAYRPNKTRKPSKQKKLGETIAKTQGQNVERGDTNVNERKSRDSINTSLPPWFTLIPMTLISSIW
jgi:hypothetical protein